MWQIFAKFFCLSPGKCVGPDGPRFSGCLQELFFRCYFSSAFSPSPRLIQARRASCNASQTSKSKDPYPWATNGQWPNWSPSFSALLFPGRTLDWTSLPWRNSSLLEHLATDAWSCSLGSRNEMTLTLSSLASKWTCHQESSMPPISPKDCSTASSTVPTSTGAR